MTCGPRTRRSKRVTTSTPTATASRTTRTPSPRTPSTARTPTGTASRTNSTPSPRTPSTARTPTGTASPMRRTLSRTTRPGRRSRWPWRTRLESAEDYLDYSAFSRLGLIDQLSSDYGEGFAVADATWAVDQLHTDWKAQAVKSRQGLPRHVLLLASGTHRPVVECLRRAVHRGSRQPTRSTRSACDTTGPGRLGTRRAVPSPAPWGPATPSAVRPDTIRIA